MKPAIQTYFSHILRNYRKREAKDLLKHTILLCIIINAIYAVLCILFESIWYLSPNVKSILWFFPVLNIAFLFLLIRIGWNVIFRHTPQQNASLLLHIGQKYPDIQDKLLNHYQLSQHNDTLSAYAISQFITLHSSKIFDDAYTSKPIIAKRNSTLGIILFLLAVILTFYPAVFRLWHVKTSYEPIFPHSISTTPADTMLYAYDSLEICMVRHAPARFPVELYHINETELQQELLTRVHDSVFHYTLNSVRKSRIYFVGLRRPHIFYPRKFLVQDTLRIHVRERPRIKTLDFIVIPPAYTQLPKARYQGNIDRISCIQGSRLYIEASLSDKAGTSVVLLADDTLRMRQLENSNMINFIPEKSGPLTLMFYNKVGIGIKEPLVYYIDIENDAYPVLSLIRPEKSDEIILNDNMTLPLMAHIQDDYGFTAFQVLYSIHSDYGYTDDTTKYKIDIPVTSDARIQIIVNPWEIPRFISPGSEIEYYFELFDNDIINGPKSTRSALFYARFPTLGDLYSKQNAEQENTMEMLKAEVLSTEEIVQNIEQIKRELLQEGTLDWEDKSVLEENLNALSQAQEQLENIQASLEKQKHFMDENALFSDEIMDSFEQLQNLMNELIDDELFDLINNIRKKMERNDMSNMEKILDNFLEKAKSFEQNLERMLEVFKRIQQEQRLEELSQRMKESLQQQNKLLEQADNMSTEDMAIQEERILRETQAWEALSRESSTLFKEEDQLDFQSFLEYMEASDISGNMQQSAQQFRQQQRQQGKVESRRAEEKLKDLTEKFSQMASTIMQRQRDDVSGSFRAIFQKTIYMSTQQEIANIFGKDIDNGSPLLHEYTSKEGAILDLVLDIHSRLMTLSKKTFLVDKSLAIVLGQVIGNLQQGIQDIEEAQITQGKQKLQKAYISMNRLGRILLERMNIAQHQQGNASGMENYLQQLQQMAGQQGQLNEGMPQPGMNGSPGSSMMDQLAKLAARQQALRRSLKEIQQGLSEGNRGKRITGDLNQIARDMEEVINQMRKNQVNRQTIMRQEQIVQRLLDASRSATSKDFKKERESKTGSQISRKSPFGLPDHFGERESLINAIRQAVLESDLSPHDKRDMEQYLESLRQQNYPLNIQEESNR
ncbi:MAG: hypothetical protein KAT14_03300 [Candidatus Marinimicrobia bacterium]|nr:hypothetical protein [Candidatus Neomarinimicrobiota bacterium]